MSASFAQAAPPFEPDPGAASYGNLTFYDSSGNQITSGTNLTSPFAWVVGGAAGDSGATKATLYFANPTHGELPALWNSTSEAGPTTFSPSLSGAPADIAAYAPTYPVVASSSANITSWVGTNVLDTTAGYSNTIQVRLTDSGPLGAGSTPGSYWESDIGYNTTASPITVDGTMVPADGWALLFPLVTPTTTSLVTSATGGTLSSGSPITLTATVPSADAGTVQFYDGTTFLADAAPSGGTATYSYTPALGSHTYTASFIPTLGDETGTGTASATIVGGSTSSQVTVSDVPPQTATSTTLSPGSNSLAFEASDTLTATVGADDDSTDGVAGSVEFLVGGAAVAGCTNPQTTTVSGAGNGGSPGVGTAACTTTALPSGADSITAVFTPTSSTYASSTSPAVMVTVAAPPQTATTTALGASSPSVADGALDTFTATVGAADNSTTGVAGSVGFLDGSTAITGCTAQATTVAGAGTGASPGVGTATCMTSLLLEGDDSITAVFTPTSSSYAESTSAAVEIDAAETGTASSLVSSSNFIDFGAPDTLTATIGAADNSTTGVTGSVEFLDGTAAISGCAVQATITSGAGTTDSPGVGTATCTTSLLLGGDDSVTAVFTPTNSTYATSTAAALAVTVAPALSRTTFNLSSNWITYGDEDAAVLSVGVSTEFGSTASGTVTVATENSSSQLCAITLSGGKGSCTLSPTQLDVGSYYNISASYAGSADFAASSTASTPESLTVLPSSSATTLSTSTARVRFGRETEEKLSVSVRPEFPGPAPIGVVVISESATRLCTITLSGGAGSCNLSRRSLLPGSYGLVATYSGSLDLESSGSASKSLIVSRETAKVALQLSSSKLTFGHEASEHISVEVSGEFAGAVPSGKVEVRISSRTICAISLSSSGKGSCTLSAKELSAGTYGLVASYGGSSLLDPAASAKETVKVFLT